MKTLTLEQVCEKALLKKAVGYDATDVFTDTTIKNGEVVSTTIRKQQKHIPPDVQALKFWLINKAPEHWKEKQTGITEENDTLKKLDELLNFAWSAASEE